MQKSDTKRDRNELQLVVPPDYRLEAMHGAHNDVGHLGLEQMLNILCIRFYWPNIEVDATYHVHTCEWCLRSKSKQDKAELYPLFATYTTGASPYGLLDYRKPLYWCWHDHVLVIMDHFMWYAKANVTPNQSTKVTVTVFWSMNLFQIMVSLISY